MILQTYLSSLPTGGKARFSEAIGVSSAYLYQMSTGLRPVKPTLARAIQAATNGAVTVHDLRPDIFGPAPGVPPELPKPKEAA